MSDIDKEHQIYMQAQWTDPEPDTLYVSVHSSKRDSEKFVVLSGNATWLDIEQAKELREFLDGAIKFIERDKRGKKREKKAPVGLPRFEAVKNFKDADIVSSQTVAGLKGRVFYIYPDQGELGIVWEHKTEDDGIDIMPADKVDFVSRPARPILHAGDHVAKWNVPETGVVDQVWDTNKYSTFAVKVKWDKGTYGYPSFWEITPTWYDFKKGDRVKVAKDVIAGTIGDDQFLCADAPGTVVSALGKDPVEVKMDGYDKNLVLSRQVLVRDE